MAAYLWNRTGARAVFLFTCSATIGFSYPAPSPASGEEFQIFNPSFTRSPRPWRDCCTDAAACSLLYARRPHRSLRNVKAELTGKPAATASLTLIHFKLSVNNSFTLPVECEERAESVPATCGPFLSLFSLRNPETGTGQHLFHRVAQRGRLWADS